MVLGYCRRRPEMSSETASVGLLRNFLGAAVVDDMVVFDFFIFVFFFEKWKDIFGNDG